MKLLLSSLFAVFAVVSSQTAPSQFERDFYQALKQLRIKGYTCPNGQTFPPNANVFAFDCRLWRAATNFAKDMATKNYFSHTSLDGKSPIDRMQAVGIAGSSENIAAGQNTPQAALDALKASPNHCPNMLDPGLNRVGTGFFQNPKSTYKSYWVQNFATDNSACDISCNPPDANANCIGPCVDFNEGCKAYQGYAGSVYCNQGWASTQCKKTCQLC